MKEDEVIDNHSRETLEDVEIQTFFNHLNVVAVCNRMQNCWRHGGGGVPTGSQTTLS